MPLQEIQKLLCREQSHSLEESEAIAAKIYETYLYLRPISLLLIEGELGAGKTFFVRALGKKLGIGENINSPSFNLLNIYQSRDWELYHYDLYRLQSPAELEELDFIEHWYDSLPRTKQVLHTIEWPEIAEDFLPNHIPLARIRIGTDQKHDMRTIELYE